MASPAELCGMSTRFARAWFGFGPASMVRNWASVVFFLPHFPHLGFRARGRLWSVGDATRWRGMGWMFCFVFLVIGAGWTLL